MLLHTTVPLSRAWNSWSDRPAEMVFLPLGVRVTPVLYSSRSRTTSEIAPRRDPVRLGRHNIDGSHIDLETELSGTTIGFSTTKPDPFTVCGRWETLKTGEWGLRFWVTLAISVEGGETVTFDADKGVALVKVGTRFVAIATADAPVQVTGHETIAALRADFETNGYFHLATRSDAAPVLALRFNLEMMRQGAYCAAVADSAALATANAIAGLAAKRAADLPPAHLSAYEGALDAVRDVVAWNTVWDETNARPYTAVTRIWNLGKFAVWYNDQTFAALLAGVFDADLARENMAVALAGATPQGNIACIVTSNDAWVDRSQPPHGALVAWQLYQRSGESSILRASYQALARNNRWWRTHRDPDSAGLVSCGTSDVGEGLYKGTAFAARNETGMDNSATHDEAVYQPETRSLSTFDVGLNCALALDAEMLARMASVLGHNEDATEFAAAAERIRALISQELWDDERKIFANRQRKGGFVRSLSPTSFYPLLCGAATTGQAEHLLRHLGDESTFAGPFGLPNATLDDPAFADNVYWRGRIWPNVNYMVWLGLRRYGFFEQASALARHSYDLFMKSWRGGRIAAENYNAVTGEAMDQGDTDPFYIWAALLPMMAVGEICDFDPWRGWSINNSGDDVSLGPILTPAGAAMVTIRDGLLTLALDGKDFLRTRLRGRLSDIVIEKGSVSLTLLPEAAGEGAIELPSIPVSALVASRLGEAELAATDSPTGGIRFEFATQASATRLSVHFSNKSVESSGIHPLTS
ncbi:MGH1-like glycoside hydrolase domain-containing protein [Shinella sp.]|uniref:MGH1-like glycoside hydrolase domain-containing protein n=1 Tax=Shinella sp. TaxID=1870904 RepID=UPI003F7264FE